MRTLRLMMCLLGLALASGEVFAADWTKTLPPDAVQGYVVGQGQRIVVVAAGGEAVDREAATASLITSLRGGPAVSLVMDDASLGDVSALDDATIVQKAKNLPVDQVHVVRVFPAGGGVMSVVVTMYDKQGAVLGGFNADTAAPLKPAGGGDRAAFLALQQDLGHAVHACVQEFKGSISAEHGIGQLKRELLARHKDPVALAVMRSIKQALDPRGIMNPGKVLPD